MNILKWILKINLRKIYNLLFSKINNYGKITGDIVKNFKEDRKK